MIIQAERISAASGAGDVGDHVFAGPANEEIIVLQGDRQDLDDMVTDARAAGAQYGFRHYKLSSKEDMTREEAMAAGQALAREFGFDFDRCIMVEHAKKRATEACGRHWHLLAPEYDVARDRVLDSSWMRPRHEKIARSIEVEYGHGLVKGYWNASVVDALRAEGKDELADRLSHLAEGDRPRSAFTFEQHQRAARLGFDEAAARAAVASAWQHGDNGPARLAALRELGLDVERGRKAGVWIVVGQDKDGERCEFGALDRFLREARDQSGMKTGAWRDHVDHEIQTAVAAPSSIEPAPAPVEAFDSQVSIEPTQDSAPTGAVHAAEEQVEPVAPATAPVEPAAPVAETPAAPRSAAGPAGSPAGAGGGQGPAMGDGVDDVIAAPDMRDPAAVARWLRAVEAADRKKRARLAAIGSGQSHGKKPQPINPFSRTADDGRAPTLDDGPHPRGDGLADHRRTGAPAEGPEGSQRLDDRAAWDGRDGGPDRAADGGAHPTGAGGFGGEGVTGPGGAATHADRRESGAPQHASGGAQREAHEDGQRGLRGGEAHPLDRDDAGRRGPALDEDARRRALARVAVRRVEKGLAAAVGQQRGALSALSARLAVENAKPVEPLPTIDRSSLCTPPPVRQAPPVPDSRAAERLRKALAASDAKADALLARRPYQATPQMLEQRTVQDELRAPIERRQEAIAAHAEAARAKAREDEARLRLRDRIAAALGRPTAAAITAASSAAAARAAEQDRMQSERRRGLDLQGADDKVQATIDGRRDEQRRFDRRSDVQTARRTKEGNDLVRDALKNGGEEARREAARDLEAFRERLLREEAERREQERQAREREQELALAREAAQAGHRLGGAGPKPPGPR